MDNDQHDLPPIDCRGRVFTAVARANASPSQFASEGETPNYVAFDIDQSLCDRVVQLRNLSARHRLYDVRAQWYPTWLGAPSLRTECDVVEVDHARLDGGSFRFSCYEKHTDLQIASDTIDLADLRRAVEAAVAGHATMIRLVDLDEGQEQDAIGEVPCLAVTARSATGDTTFFLPTHRFGTDPSDADIASAFERATGLPQGAIASVDREALYTLTGELLTEAVSPGEEE